MSTSQKRKDYLKRTGNAVYHRYEKTVNGFLMRLYRNMKSRVTGVQKTKYHLYHDLYLLPKEEFYKWAKENKKFQELWISWKLENHKRLITPSVDRVDSSKGYTLDNMEWVTFQENSRRGAVSKVRKREDRVRTNGRPLEANSKS